MGISRDAVCGDRIGFIAEMGAMEEEFAVFGCGYLEDGKIKYRVSSDKNEMYAFMLHAGRIPLYPTPIHILSERKLLGVEEKEDFIYQLKQQLAQKLKTFYPKEFFIDMKQLITQAPVNSAWPLLQILQEEIEGNFDFDELYLYRILLEQCYQKKLLDEKHKRLGEAWLEKNYNQMENDTVVKERYQRTFYGFAYYKKEELQWYIKSSTDLERVLEHRLQLEHDNIFVSPILQKTFWFAETQQLPRLKEKYVQWLKELIQLRQALLLQLYQLQTPISRDVFQKLLGESDFLTEESRFALEWYGKVWNIA